MAKKREIFETLTKRKLVEVSHHLGFRSWQILSKGEIVIRLSRQRKKSMEEMLDLLKINELRHICIKLNLNSGGVKKQTIIDRIIGNERSNKSKKTIPPKIKQPINKPTKARPQPKSSVELKRNETENKRIKNMGRNNNVAAAEFEKRPKTSFVKSNNFQDKANFVWQVADDILRGTFKRHEYGDVTLPFVVLRRLDCVL
jgi:type I restriction enzyme M protein